MTSNTSAISPSITALLEIMSHEAGPMRRRLDASEALLTYETPPEVAEYTKSFLTSVIEDRERVTADTRLRASTLLRRVEAKRIAQRTIGSVSTDHWREVWRPERYLAAVA
jgi:ABC-type molybdenum transport system ATPase subunit/photorepair protein PhrA